MPEFPMNMNRLMRQKLSQEAADLTQTVEQMNLKRAYRTFQRLNARVSQLYMEWSPGLTT